MFEIIIDASKIKGEGSNMLKLLAEFLKDKTAGEVTQEGAKLTLKTSALGVNRKYLRVLLKKFLHHQELKANYRVAGGDEETLVIREKKIYETD